MHLHNLALRQHVESLDNCCMSPIMHQSDLPRAVREYYETGFWDTGFKLI